MSLSVQGSEPQTFDEWFVTSSYQELVRQEGVPLYEGSALADMQHVPLGDWERRGGKAAYTRLGDQESYNLQIVEIPPGGELKPERHMYDAVMHGRGASTIWQEGEPKRTVEWQEGSLLAIPLNAWHQEFNSSGTEPCRFLVGTNMAQVINLYRNLELVFSNSFSFTDRYSFNMEHYLEKENHWAQRLLESNFIRDVRELDLEVFPERGRQTSIVRMSMAGTVHRDARDGGV